jgi:hypothetical protein
MNPQQPGQIVADVTLYRHRAFAEVLESKRSMGWLDWSMFIHESCYLTPDGRRIALWAINLLQRALRDDFPQRAIDSEAKQAATTEQELGTHPVFPLGLWLAIDVPRVYEKLIQLAAHLLPFNLPSVHFSCLQLTRHWNLNYLETLSSFLSPPLKIS